MPSTFTVRCSDRREKGSLQGDFYEYTPEGLLKSAISGRMAYSYTYDAIGRLSKKSASGRTLLSLEYDGNGTGTRQTDVTGKITEYRFDLLDRLTEVWDDGDKLAEYGYYPDGTIQREIHGPLMKEYAYDADRNLTGLKIQCGGSLLADNRYTYDGNGNRLEKQQLSGTTRYAYDALNQLVKAEYPTYGEELFYDRAGNRTCRRSAGVEEVYAYDAGNHLIKLTRNGADISFQYDRAGNLVKDDKASYTYDAFNRNTRVETFDGNIQINRYDAEGLWAEMEENGRLAAFIFNPAKEVVTETEDRTVLRYIRGSELIARNTDAVRTYYHYASDEMGSITHVTDEDGNILNRYEYDAWGNLTLEDEQVSNRFKYTGEQFDPVTQQYYLRARFYNPALARFMQEDTYRGDGLNLYAYCANNPVCYVDPSGHWCEKKEDIYRDLVEKNGLDINNIDPDTRQRLMAEAANEARRKAASSEGKHTPRLPGPVLPEQNQPSRPVADMPDDGGRGESGSGSLNEETFTRYLADGRQVTDVTNLPGNTGIQMSRRLTTDEMTFLTQEYGVEFAQVYKYGNGVNGGGGQYYLYSGTVDRVTVPIGNDIMLINHTHPGGTASPSSADKLLLGRYQQLGSPQRSSEIIPIGKENIRFNTTGLIRGE